MAYGKTSPFSLRDWCIPYYTLSGYIIPSPFDKRKRNTYSRTLKEGMHVCESPCGHRSLVAGHN
jgi:hypothetical protein